MLSVQPIQIYCSDHTTIAGNLYKTNFVKGAVIICPATGIKRGFYHHFAVFLAEHGYGVITYDNQGIGDSLKGSIELCPSSLVSWGQIDQTAALERLKEEFPSTTYHMIGHSAGGQLVGLMENAKDLSSIFNYGSSSGSLRNMKLPFKVKAHFFMSAFIPLNNLLLGYTNSPWMKMGEPLPKNVAAQWSEWCRGSGYIQRALGKYVFLHHYKDLDIPSMWANSTDDEISNNKNVEDMIQVFDKLKVERLILDPKKFNYSSIGHMGFFKDDYQELWNYALNWLDQHSKSI
ncbi:MAG TPA: alpha/beta fold hydrolase [Chitinophagales bacterium]|nr:alpha/beta fold hydrolase [Chitinophagales bacterium]